MSPARVRLCAGGRVDASAQKHNAGRLMKTVGAARCGAARRVCCCLYELHTHISAKEMYAPLVTPRLFGFFLLIGNLFKDSVVVMATAQRRVLHVLRVNIHTSS